MSAESPGFPSEEHPLIHPHTELRFINDEIGYGVVATRRIPKGTITWCLDRLDRVLTQDEADALGAEYNEILDRYAFRDAEGRLVLCWDLGRYVNHSFHPSCLPTAYDFELAVRDIEPGEELTDDYGSLNLDRPFEALPERHTRRRLVRPDDPTRLHVTWDRKLRDAFRFFNEVEQPLDRFLAEPHLETARAIARGTHVMDSVLLTYYRRA